MEEETKSQFTLRRREFLKIGLAAGVAAGIPMGIIPMAWSRKAYAEVAEGLEKIPAETRWAIATKAMIGGNVVLFKTLFDIVGQEKYNEMVGQMQTEGGKASKQIADALGLAAADAKSTAEAVQLVALVSMGPELKFQTVEATAEKAVIRGTGCPWWNRVKEFGISDDLLSVGSPAWTSSLTKSLNPKVTLSGTRSMCRGDAYCEWIYKLQQ